MSTVSLTDCVLSGELSALRYLLQARADANEKDSVGQAPLLRASFHLNVDMTRALLSARADANTTSSDRRTALHKVAISDFTRFGLSCAEFSDERSTNIRKSVEVAKLLLGARADLNIQSGTLDPSEARQGETALHVAAALGRHELVEILLKGGADTNLLTRSGLTALDNAAGRGVQWMPGFRSESGAAKVVEQLQHVYSNGGFCTGNLVRVVGLQARPELNGQLGTLSSFNVSKQRWQVELQSSLDGSPLLGLRLSNLELVADHGTLAEAPELEECVVCLEHVETADRRTLDCGHVLHKSCATQLRRFGARGCPTCGNEAADQAPVLKLLQEYLMYDAHDDHDAAFRCLNKAMELSPPGNYELLVNLGLMYLHGEGTQKNDRKAANIFQRASDAGSVVAAFNLGCMYLGGCGIKADPRKAAQLFRRAHTDINANFNLARMHLEGNGVAQNFKSAFRLLQKARQGGHAKAIANLAWMYVRGQGVDSNLQEALSLFQEASSAGDEHSGPFAKLLQESPEEFLESFSSPNCQQEPPLSADVRSQAAEKAASNDRARCAEAFVAEGEQDRQAQARRDKEEEMRRQIEEGNAAARALKEERRRGAGVVASTGADVAAATHLPEEHGRASGKPPADQLSKQSKQRARKQQKKAQRLAAAKDAAASADAEATRAFLRETAEGFIERPEQDYHIEPAGAPKVPRPRRAKATKVNDVTEDMTLSLWEAKLKHPGIVNDYN
mmetsp:Transcript_113151/g.205789  ORF Transcript_113151/g.205789 Transcript_113151/m.205789 type:complete len:732 (+) Transcript_113151:191-2386(+)